jgi:type IV pilus assembly protein PilA
MLKSTLARMREARMQEVEGEGVAEAGFTLIELMVVLLIIAILLAIAIPTFLGVTSSARDRAVQSNLTNAMTEVQAQYQNTQDYSFATVAAQPILNTSAPEFTWSGGVVSTDQNHMSVNVIAVASAADNQGIIVAALNKTTGKCWYSMNLQANPVSGVYPGNFGTGAGQVSRAGTYYSNQQTSTTATCNASNGAGTTWKWGTSYSDANGNN